MRDTGCVFPFGRALKDVRVLLLTADQAKADALGRLLHKWGLPLVRRLLVQPTVRGLVAVNPFGEPKFNPQLGGKTPPIVRWGGDPIGLETDEPENVVRFAKWLCEKNGREQKAKADEKAKDPSLVDLANAGVIETVQAE
jgi:hypothetical protein